MPTGIGDPTTVLVAVSITATVLPSEFVLWVFGGPAEAGANRQARDNAKASFLMPHPFCGRPGLGRAIAACDCTNLIGPHSSYRSDSSAPAHITCAMRAKRAFANFQAFHPAPTKI